MEIPQTFTVRYRVRFDEAGADGNLRPSGLLRYAQDLAWQHSEAAGFDRDWYDERGTFWLVRTVGLRIVATVGYGETVTATTGVTGWRRVWARRHTTFEDAGGTLVAEADTDWVLLTLEGRPSRIPDEISNLFAPGSVYRPEKVAVEPTPADVEPRPFVVRSSDVDPLGHLNNAGYIDLVDEAAAHLDREPGSEYRAEYIRPTLAGADIDVAAWPTGDGWLACRMSDAAGNELFRALALSR